MENAVVDPPVLYDYTIYRTQFGRYWLRIYSWIPPYLTLYGEEIDYVPTEREALQCVRFPHVLKTGYTPHLHLYMDAQ